MVVLFLQIVNNINNLFICIVYMKCVKLSEECGRMSKKINNQNGFTLVELIVVVAILATLSGIGFVSYQSSIVVAEENVCLANRKQLHAIFLSYQAYNSGANMSNFLAGDYDDIDTDFDINCPCGGTFYLGDDGQVKCSEHEGNDEDAATAAEGGQATFTPQPTQAPNGGGSSGGSSSGGGSGSGTNPTEAPTEEPSPEPTEEPTPTPTPVPTPTPTPQPTATPEPATVPGTDLRVQDSYWPQTQDYGNNNVVITVQPGGVFEYQGNHYVVTNDISLTKSQAAYGPAGSDAQRLTGVVLQYANGTTWIKNVRKGDICKVSDGLYAVYVDDSKWACNPDVSDDQWYNIPNN